MRKLLIGTLMGGAALAIAGCATVPAATVAANGNVCGTYGYVDVNNDGFISGDEWNTYRTNAYGFWDVDKDGRISRSEFEVLSALARSDHPLRASEVTSITGISGASTTKHTERLAKLGLVERKRLERDGRVVLLTLTDDGRALVEKEFARRLARERQMLDGLDDDEVQVLSDLLRKVVRNVENHYPA